MHEGDNAAPRTRILVVDDHDMFAESLGRVLRDEPDIDVVGRAATCAAAVELSGRLRPDLAIVDYRLPDCDGVETTRRILRVSPTTRIVMLTSMSDRRIVEAALDAGCSGFLTKDKAVRDLLLALRVVQAGEAFLSPDILAGLLPRFGRGERNVGFDLSVREREVLELMASGIANKEIAVRLRLSLNTIRNHVQNVLVKLGAHSKLEAVAIASREGLMEGSLEYPG